MLLIPIYILSHFFPRNKNIWVFGSSFGRRFADNPKYFFLYMQKITSQGTSKDVRVIWISRSDTVIRQLVDKGFEAYHIQSFRGIFYALRAGVYIFDTYLKDISFWLSGGALKLNLWHGIPLKKIALDNKFDQVRNPKNKLYKVYYYFRRLQDERPYHYTIATSDVVADKFSSAFGITRKNIFITGYPRNDILLENEVEVTLSSEESGFYDRLKILKDHHQKIAIYMPTFRASEIDFWDVINLNELNQRLAGLNVVLVTKLHPMSKLHEQFNAIDYSNILNMPADFDPYPFLRLTDALITDYSSVYFDYLLLDRPIVFFPYDLEKYMSESRELYYDYNDVTPGPKAMNVEDLLLGLSNLMEQPVLYQEERLHMLNRYFTYKDCYAAERLYYKIISRQNTRKL